MSRSLAPTETRVANKPVRELRRFWRIAAAAAVVLGPLSITIGRGIMPYWTDQDTAEIVTATLANPVPMEVLNWAGLIFMPLLLGGILAMGFVARRGAPVLATVGAALTFLGWIVSAEAGSTDYITHLLGSNGFTVDQITSIVTLMQNEPVATVAGFFWLVAHLAGMILLAIALGRAGIVQRWVWIALIASQPIHFISAVIIPSRLLDVTLGWGLTTLCCLVVAASILKMDDDDWDLAPLARPSVGNGSSGDRDHRG